MIISGYTLTNTEHALSLLALDFTAAVTDACVTMTRAANNDTQAFSK